MNYKEYFKNKKITVMGLGLLGRGLNDVKFLAECEADLIVTDLKKEKELKPTLEILKRDFIELGISDAFSKIKFVLGEHRLEDFKDRDLILKAAGVPLDSPYIAEAKKNKIPVEMDESLFAKLAPPITLVGITGTRGKTTTTALVFEVARRAKEKGALTGNVYLGGNVKGLATLPLLKDIARDDIVILELSSWQLQGFGDAGISPQISVFTNFMNDHLNYYKGSLEAYFADKANIFKNQTSNNYLVVGEELSRTLSKMHHAPIRSRIIKAEASEIPRSWNLSLKGTHNEENIACAIAVGQLLRIPSEIIKEAVEGFEGVPGRMQKVRSVRGIDIYNDTTATTPDATLVALRTLSRNKNIVLIIGGADKGLNMDLLTSNISQYCKAVILLAGTGTMKIHQAVMKVSGVLHEHAQTLDEAVTKAIDFSGDGDVVLFSPAFASFGMFKNEYDRGDRFLEIVNKLS
jgi:UDP-N-acetylmuramoylalanine--D-glutamate ligase